MRRMIPFLVFFMVLAGHFLYIVPENRSTTSNEGQWASYNFDQADESRIDRYIQPGEYWLGLSYGIAGAFASFCLLRAIRKRRESLAGATGGIALSWLLWAGVCFFTGCCGSPMLPIYLGLLGPKFIGVTKPLTFVVTLISIIIGATVMLRRSNSKMCEL